MQGSQRTFMIASALGAVIYACQSPQMTAHLIAASTMTAIQPLSYDWIRKWSVPPQVIEDERLVKENTEAAAALAAAEAAEAERMRAAVKVRHPTWRALS